MFEKPTIFALSSGRGRAAIAVVRISGPAVPRIIERMAAPLPRKRTAVLRKLRHPKTGELLDEALIFWSAAPKSETGEDVAEFQVHGSRGVIAAVLDALSRIEGCRLAEPGEFTRRAFDNGRIDLAQAEALADLIEAETEAQRRQALANARGQNSNLYEGWRDKLVNAAGLIEAAIDFSDEADVASDAVQLSRRVIEGLAAEIGRHLDDGHRGELVRDGFRVALAGPPNVGKSSLLNALARREAAIVSEEAGTTRDVIEVKLDVGGYPVIVADTAGLRDSGHAVEQEGMRRSLATAAGADLIVWLTDVEHAEAQPPPDLQPTAGRTVRVVNKIDLVPDGSVPSAGGALPISAKTGAGISELLAHIGAAVAERIGESGEPAVTSARHRRLLEECHAALTGSPDGDAVELRAEDVRRAAAALGRITGRVDPEEVLGAVFSRFCIGK